MCDFTEICSPFNPDVSRRDRMMGGDPTRSDSLLGHERKGGGRGGSQEIPTGWRKNSEQRLPKLNCNKFVVLFPLFLEKKTTTDVELYCVFLCAFSENVLLSLFRKKTKKKEFMPFKKKTFFLLPPDLDLNSILSLSLFPFLSLSLSLLLSLSLSLFIAWSWQWIVWGGGMKRVWGASPPSSSFLLHLPPPLPQ